MGLDHVSKNVNKSKEQSTLKIIFLVEFRDQKEDGLMCMFTLKTPSQPEYIVVTEAGVMSVDIHPTLPYLVVLGLYDGNVEVYDLQVSCTVAQYCSNSVTNKHASTVWQVSLKTHLQCKF